MSETVISVENVSKLYRLGEVGTGSLAHDVNRWWHRVRGKEDPYRQVGETNDREQKGDSDYAWALRGVSFEVKQGEVLGIIGKNGAGKSTLLKILSRVTTQTEGRIKIKGRIASLLEVGTGFHPELTGRENIFLNGAILGMRKAEIARKFDEIVEFSGCARYIDTPVKRYSSGMYVRLAFAVAAHLEPEILIVDEVLAVGDAEFQKKCLGKMKEVSGKGGRTVLFVSHNMTAVRSLCSRAILLKTGSVTQEGDTEECIHAYLQQAAASPTEKIWEDPRKAPGNGAVVFRAVRAISRRTDGQDPSLFDTETSVDIEVEFEVLKKSHFHITLHFMAEQGVTAFTSGCTQAEGWQERPEPGRHRLTCKVPGNLFNEGNYSLRVLLVENGTRASVILEDVIGFDVKDLVPRKAGAWHGREPGPLKPRLLWKGSRL